LLRAEGAYSDATRRIADFSLTSASRNGQTPPALVKLNGCVFVNLWVAADIPV